MPTLSEYTNVYGTALKILRDKGYQIWFDKQMNMYRAERDGWDFASDSPCGLLGVVAIYEYRKPTKYVEYWWRDKEIDLRDVPHEPAPYETVMATQGRPPKKT